MQTIPRPVFVLHSDPGLVQRLGSSGVLDRGGVRRVADWSALTVALRRAPASVLAVVDPRAPSSGEPRAAPELRVLLQQLPSVTVLAAFPVGVADGPLLEALVRWGVADVLDVERECTPGALARRLADAQGRTLRRILERALPRHTPSRTRALLTTAAEVVAAGGLAPELGRALGVSVRTVARWCERADLPPARRLLGWLRVLTAAELLDDPGRSVAGVARACGYAGDATLRGALRAFVDLPPPQLRERGAFETAAAAFVAELRAIRERNRATGIRPTRWLN